MLGACIVLAHELSIAFQQGLSLLVSISACAAQSLVAPRAVPYGKQKVSASLRIRSAACLHPAPACGCALAAGS